MTWQKTQADRGRDQAVYGSPEYLRNKKLVRRRSGGHCEIRTPGICDDRATSCDHDLPVSKGGTHDLANLRDACTPCHRHKTAGEGGGYRHMADPEPAQRTQW